MPRKRDPRRDEAFEMWKEHKGEITNREIAKQLDVDEKKVAVWKQRDKWNVVQQTRKKKTKVVQRNDNNQKEEQHEEQNDSEERAGPFELSDPLNDKQRLFCLHYIKTFNATNAAIKAGYSPASAHVEGCRLLKNDKVAAYLHYLKEQIQQEIFVDAVDIVNKYIKIAFADITDYVRFGKKLVPVMTQFGPLIDKKSGKAVMKDVNYVDFNESDYVDGTIIAEAKQGKDGVSIKLEDRMKALDKLEKYFNAIPDASKDKSIELMQARIDGIKSEIKRKDAEPDKPDIQPYLEALKGKTSEVWEDGDEE